MKFVKTFLFSATSFMICGLHAQTLSEFSQSQIDSVLKSGSGLTGAGKAVVGSGWGGWRSGSQGVSYIGNNAKRDWSGMRKDEVSASVVRKGLLPQIKPIWDAHIRDAVIIVGGDGNYYMTGSTGDNIWAFNDGVELWRSSDLKDWKYLGMVCNDNQSPWREKPGIVRVQFEENGKIKVADKQPEFILIKN
jgi:xylan 1,4-beta-xylosidase